MYLLQNRKILVLGNDHSGTSACHLLRQRGADVSVFAGSQPAECSKALQELAEIGVRILASEGRIKPSQFDLVVATPAYPETGLIGEFRRANVPVIGEMELGYQQSLCLSLAVTGTKGKTTTAELISRLLDQANRKTLIAGDSVRPATAVVDQTRELDFLTLDLHLQQLERTQYFRPVVGVLLNLTTDPSDQQPSLAGQVRAAGRMFANQQPFDWAIIQSEALALLREQQIPVPAKVITFSAQNRRADIYLDRTLLVSRLDGWTGPLLDLEKCQIAGPHHAENLMAALAVGRVLRLSLEEMTQALSSYALQPGRGNLVAEIGGVRFVNDAGATNVDSLLKGIQAIEPAQGKQANIWLISGGREEGRDFHQAGPLLSERVKGAFLFGPGRDKIRAAWSLFTPCLMVDSLLEAIRDAAKVASPGDVVLLSPACSSIDQFRDYQKQGEVFRHAVEGLAGTTDGGRAGLDHKASETMERFQAG